MKQETINLLKLLAAKGVQHNYRDAEDNDEYDFGYNIGWQDSESSLAKKILELEKIEEITA